MQVDHATYLHRLSRSTRSEDAFGLCVNVVGGAEDAARPAGEREDGPGKLAALKALAAAHPQLAAFGPHYDVPRDVYRTPTPEAPLVCEVNVHAGQAGKEAKWEDVDLVLDRCGSEDMYAWQASFELNGQTVTVPAMNAVT